VPDRIARPPIRLAGGFPDSTLCAVDGKHFLGAEPDDLVAVVRLGRHQLIHDDETDADVAVLKVRAVALADDQPGARTMLAELLAAHTGQLQFPDDEPAGDAARRAELEADVLHWCETDPVVDGMSPRALWEHYFGGEAPAGPRGAALVHLVEFADEYQIGGGEGSGGGRSTVDVPLPDADQAETGPDEADARHQVAAGPEFAEPEPDWDDTSAAAT